MQHFTRFMTLTVSGWDIVRGGIESGVDDMGVRDDGGEELG